MKKIIANLFFTDLVAVFLPFALGFVAAVKYAITIATIANQFNANIFIFALALIAIFIGSPLIMIMGYLSLHLLADSIYRLTA